MKVFAISDLHLSLCGQKPMEIFGDAWDNYLDKIKSDWLERVKEDDVVLIAGDISWAMKIDEFKIDAEYLNVLPGKKIIIRGNHDYWWGSLSQVRNALTHNVYALQNDCIKLDNLIICGTRGWVIPERGQILDAEDDKIYKRELIRAKLSLDAMKKIRTEGDRVIFMIHYPPFNSSRCDNEFMKLFRDYEVNDVIYGHLHGKQVRAVVKETIGDINYYLTSCDLVDNKLITIIDEN